MPKPMSLPSRRELLCSIRQRYLVASRKDKQRILDEFIAASGYHRKYAISLLRLSGQGKTSARNKRRRQRTYSDEVKQALTIIWQAANRLCSKRLVPFLPEFISTLERFSHLSISDETRKKLLAISPATVDRLLAEFRHGRPRGLSTTRPGALIKQQIPVRTFADWDDLKPGFFEADLVAHCGTSTHGPYLSTFVLTDVATGWTECCALVSHDQEQILRALKQLRTLLPFPLQGLDTDNGSEFINYQLLHYCQQEKITFTRCRPYKKNDQCHVEQKNGSLVRRMVGYDRFEGSAACRQLATFYGVFRLYVNFFQPSLKLIAKERHGSKVLKKYDKAQTPYQRVLESAEVSEEMKAQLRRQYEQLDPVALLRQLEGYQDSLWQYAWRSADWVADSESSAVSIGLPAGNSRKDEKITAEQEPEREQRTYRHSGKVSKHHLVRHTWRTRPDPFVLVQELIEQQLEAEPGLCAKELLQNLQQQYPGQFNEGQLRTLQRRVKQWREQKGLPCESVIVPTMPIGVHPSDLSVSSLSR